MRKSALTSLSASQWYKAAAFTLIELLVVISIIAVLAGILLPVIGGVMENARRTEAKSTETQILTAVKSFAYQVGLLMNPWGAGYRVRYDTGCDDQVMLPELEGDTPGSRNSVGATTDSLRFRIIV